MIGLQLKLRLQITFQRIPSSRCNNFAGEDNETCETYDDADSCNADDEWTRFCKICQNLISRM